MRREEKRRKCHQAILNTLYPPPPSPPFQAEEDKPLNAQGDDFDVESINPEDYYGKTSASKSGDEEGSEDHQSEPKKLTRAQRKRHRKKMLRQDAARRHDIIGPLLPIKTDGLVYDSESPDVRQNAAVEVDAMSDKPGESSASVNQNKLKQRRMVKRLAREKSRVSGTENCDQHQSFKSLDGEDQSFNRN